MASVFLSYDREDAPRAKTIADVLENAGHSVWWDQHIKGGAQYSKEIERALKQADAVVVLWSERSVESPWVRDEAAAGRDSGRLVPVLIDDTEPPLGFRQYQAVKLPTARPGRGARQALLDAVSTAGGASEVPQTVRRRRAPRDRRFIFWTAAIVLLAAIAAGLVLWRPWDGRGETVLAVAPGSSDAVSQALSRDLAAKLGLLQASSATPVKLVEASSAMKPDLTFEAASSGPAGASLVLKSARDSSILWSKDFEQPSGSRADLLQQVTYTAARIIACAMQGLDGPVRLKPAPLKAYLNACAQLSELGTFSLKLPLPLLLEVIEASPTFEPAWQALLFSEADISNPLANEAEGNPRALADLRRHIDEARKVDPTMPAADVAEAQLRPPRDFANRVRLVEQATERRPDDPAMVMRLAGAMSAVGRQKDAVRLAARAVALDPLSPLLHSNYTAMIAYSGNFDAARRELAKAEKLWPGTASIEDAQYRFHYRYGDPRIARALFDKHIDTGGKAPRMLLAARENPGPATIEPLIAHVHERLRKLENPSAGIGFATLAFAAFDRKEDMFATLLKWPKPDDLAIISEVFFRPELKEERFDTRFMQVAKRAGLLDYWVKSGKWPDFCFEPDLPYDCKAEAAKLVG